MSISAQPLLKQFFGDSARTAIVAAQRLQRPAAQSVSDLWDGIRITDWDHDAPHRPLA